MQFCPIAKGPGNQVKPFGDFCDPLFLWGMLYLILVFVCVCVHVCVHISTGMHVCVDWESDARCLYLCVPYFVRQAFSLKLELAILARLTGKPAHSSVSLPLFLLPHPRSQCLDYRHVLLPLVIVWMLETQTQGLMLANTLLTPHLPVSVIIY